MDEGKKLPHVLDLLANTIVIVPAVSYMLYRLMNNSFPKSRERAYSAVLLPFPMMADRLLEFDVDLYHPRHPDHYFNDQGIHLQDPSADIIDGWSRGQFIGVKLIEVLLLASVEHIGGVPDRAGVRLHRQQGGRPASRFGRVSVYPVLLRADAVLSIIAFLLGLLIKRAGLAMQCILIYMLARISWWRYCVMCIS